MNNIRTRKTASHRWIGTAVLVLLFAFSAAVGAQNKKKGDGTSAPAHQAQPTHQTTTQPTTQPTRPTTTTNTSQPGRPNNTQTTPQNTAQPGRQNNTQTTPQNTAQPGRQNNTQTTPQNTAQPGRQNNGQQFGRPNNPQTTPQNAAQPGRQNNSQQFGRPNNPQTTPQNASRGQQGQQFGGRSGPQTIRTPNGGMVNRDNSGQVRSVRTPGGAVITHQPNGLRSVEVTRGGNQRIVTSGGGRGGYAQRPLMVHNQAFVQRTYYSHGQAYARVYRPVTYRGMVLNMYTPMRFYRPAFYAYAYSPWITPVSYSWGWGGSPWFGFYGGYFSPYRVYAGPAFWLTDYLFATTFQEAYQERMDANLQGGGYAAGGPVGLTPDVKQAVADEVHRQLDMEAAEGQSMTANGGSGDVTAPIFSDNISHVFVVSSALMVDDRGPGCPVSEGDVLQLRPGSSNGATADTVVLASKGTDCRRGSVVSVQLQDLQEMQNHMRATMDQGLAELQSRQGRGGLPALPAAAAAAPVTSPIAAAVQPDPNVATELSQAAQEANSGEQDVVSQGAAAAGNAAGPVTISLGQSMADVESMNGKPDKVIDLGAKKIYVYRDLKITFTDGRVSDVQ
jgi:hypothetical protein